MWEKEFFKGNPEFYLRSIHLIPIGLKAEGRMSSKKGRGSGKFTFLTKKLCEVVKRGYGRSHYDKGGTDSQFKKIK